MNRLRVRLGLAIVLGLALAALCVKANPGADGPAGAADEPGANAADARDAFPDFGFMPPPEQYKGPFFNLRQDDPAAEPGADKRPAFLDITRRAKEPFRLVQRIRVNTAG